MWCKYIRSGLKALNDDADTSTHRGGQEVYALGLNPVEQLYFYIANLIARQYFVFFFTTKRMQPISYLWPIMSWSCCVSVFFGENECVIIFYWMNLPSCASMKDTRRPHRMHSLRTNILPLRINQSENHSECFGGCLHCPNKRNVFFNDGLALICCRRHRLMNKIYFKNYYHIVHALHCPAVCVTATIVCTTICLMF